MKTDRKENVKFIITNCKDRFTSEIITTYPNMFSFGLSSVFSKVFVTDFEHVLFCWKRFSTSQQTNTYSKSAAKTLKANSRDCASLLTTCSMSKTLLKWFLVYYEHVFVYCHAFAVTIFFQCIYCQFWTYFTPWSTFICYQFCIESRRSHQRCYLKKGVL